jgi:Asp-tRNA(Asn)/Glu-tRNA(Gln) amidotransferase A subunit family amidase
MKPLHQLGVAEAAALLARGAITSEALVRDCLARIAEDEPRVLAWEHLDADGAVAQARRIDAASPRPLLGGIPLGVKDIIATADMPTGYGTPILAGQRAAADAACVGALRAAGAVVLGKTVSTELALYAPGKTRNPHDPTRTPGGSSSGSAAAVAAAMVPAALGTQTAGSVIRPAAFCGIVGMKPSFGLLSLEGVLPLAASLDTLGVLSREVADLPLLLRALGVELEAAAPERPPRVAVCRTEAWPLASSDARRAVEDAAAALARAGARVMEAELPAGFEGLREVHATIMGYEIARSLGELRARGADRMSPKLRELLADGDAVAPESYRAAQERAEACRRRLPEVFDRIDVLLTASTPGEAPALSGTGDPAFNRIWTLLGLPCLHLPTGRGPAGLPLGVQLVAAPRADAALIGAGAWAEAALRR